MPARRAFLLAAAAALLAPAAAGAAEAEIRMRSDADGSWVGFDPIGLWVAPGTTVRWRCESNVHSTAAYHPGNDGHSLRIPEAARPWRSGYLQPGDSFAVRLAAEGVYDYYCAPHEMAGMVGRIVVGRPGGPGTRPFDYFVAEGRDWLPVPEAARRAFPAVEAIMARRRVPLPPPQG
jgi:plastocyanin